MAIIETVANTGGDFPDYAGLEAALPANPTNDRTAEMFKDEEISGTLGLWNTPNSGNKILKLTVADGVRHNGKTYGNGGRVTRNAAMLIIGTNDVLVEWLNFRQTAGTAGHTIQINAGIARAKIAHCLIDQSGSGDKRAILLPGSTVTLELSTILIGTSGGSAVTTDIAGSVCRYVTIVSKDGVSVVAGFNTSAANGFKCNGCIVVGTFSGSAFNGTFHGDSDHNLSSDTSAPGTTTYKSKGVDTVIVNDDGSDLSRVPADLETWTAGDLTADTGSIDIRSQTFAGAAAVVGAEQKPSGGGGGEVLNDLEAGTLEVWALVSSMNAGAA